MRLGKKTLVFLPDSYVVLVFFSFLLSFYKVSAQTFQIHFDILQLWYWTTTVLERPCPAAGWIFVLWYSSTLVPEPLPPVAGWIFVLFFLEHLFPTFPGGTALVLQYWNGHLGRPAGFSFAGSTA